MMRVSIVSYKNYFFNLFISLAVEKLIGELVACEKHAKVQKDFNLQKFSMTLQTPML